MHQQMMSEMEIILTSSEERKDPAGDRKPTVFDMTNCLDKNEAVASLEMGNLLCC